MLVLLVLFKPSLSTGYKFGGGNRGFPCRNMESGTFLRRRWLEAASRGSFPREEVMLDSDHKVQNVGVTADCFGLQVSSKGVLSEATRNKQYI